MKSRLSLLSLSIILTFVSCEEKTPVQIETISIPTIMDINPFGAKLSATINGFSIAEISRGNYGFLISDTSDDAVFQAWKDGQNSSVTVLYGSSVDGSGNFTANLSSLSPVSSVSLCAFFITKDGESFIGGSSNFTTSAFAPTITLSQVSPETPGYYSCKLDAIALLDETAISQCTYGVLFSTQSMEPNNGHNLKACSGIQADGIYSTVLTNLSPETQYYCRAYVCLKKTNDFYYSDEISFTTRDLSDMVVDMGLSVMWANCNLGAEDYSMSGDCYMWGGTTPSTYCSLDSYPFYNKASNSYSDIGTSISGTEYDAATVRLGKKWRIPTTDEVAELHENVTCLLIDDKYIKLTSNITGKSIYIKYLTVEYPANAHSSTGEYPAELWCADTFAGSNEKAYYWDLGYTYFKYGESYDRNPYLRYRESALVIRPVCEYE